MKTTLKKIARKILGRKTDRLLELPPADRELILALRRENLTYLTTDRLASIVETWREIEKQGLEGIAIEAGCALGGSSILIARSKAPARKFYVHDVFEMIPPPGEKDGEDVKQRYETIAHGEARGLGGEKYYGYEENLIEKVRANLARHGVTEAGQSVFLVKGLVQDTLLGDEPVVFAHIDVDWYDPVMTCLQRIIPRLTVGGSLILDDYHAWSGCRKATDEYFAGKSEEFAMDDSAGHMKVTRVRAADRP